MGSKKCGDGLSRRRFLRSSVALGAVAAVGGGHREVRAEEDDLGVASGDPMPTSVVLWTRVPGPHQVSGGQLVFYEVSNTPEFGVIVSVGALETGEEVDFTVRVRAEGLTSNTWFYYRFWTDSGYNSVIGRTRTAPAPGDDVSTFKIGFVSCHILDHGHYNVYKVMAEEDLDLILHLGDNIYEGTSGVTGRDLATYRRIHQLFLARPELQEVRRLFPWMHIWDDHEVYNNYAGTSMNAEQRVRQAGSYQAFSEYLPLDPSIVIRDRGDGIMELPLYRNYAFGDLLEIFALDGRQYRSPIVCGDDSYVVDCEELQDPDRTMLGREQTDWLKSALSESQSQWKLLMSGTMMMELTVGGQTNDYFMKLKGDTLRDGHDGLTYNADAWDGFPANRAEILGHVDRENIDNLVVCTGDMHNCYVAELQVDPSTRRRRKPVGVEFVGGSVTSTGYGEYTGGYDISKLMFTGLHATNPHLKYIEAYHHCFTRLVLDGDRLKANYVFVSTVLSPEFEVHESIDFIVESGSSELIRER